MKGKILPLLLLSSYTISAQLTITSGAQFSLTGNVQLTFQNADLINNGNLAAGNSTISFTGGVPANISGSHPIQFFELRINKTNNASVLLQRAIEVSERVFFSSGFLDLNGFNADLGTTGHLENEQDNSRITGANGGQVVLSTTLNAPSFENPGNLGAIISSNQNLGNIIIKRGHQAQSGSGLTNSILRYYDIIPANNVNLNAVLQINYINAELNGQTENALVFFKTDDGFNWSNQGFTSRIPNFVSKNGINSFSRWTLSNDNTPLPVLFILFNAKCEGTKVILTWKTAQEQNSSHFNVERSSDGNHWIVIGSLAAAGNSLMEKSYSFTDFNPLQDGIYRIAQYDLNGTVHYTSILRSLCGTPDLFNLWPNPVHDNIFINIATANESRATIKIFDSKGALVKAQAANVLPGINQMNINIRSLANGPYTISVDWNNGQARRTQQLIKQ